MLELHQFRHSSFCEKVRLILAAKGLQYHSIEVTPGLGQLELFRLSGQRQVPVLVDGPEVIADSSAIAQHLESQVPTPPLIPEDPADRARVLLLEDWADTALAAGARQALLQAASSDAVMRGALLPEATPSLLRSLVGALPTDLLTPLGDTIGQSERRQLQVNLEQLAVLLAPGRFLVGDRLSLADLAVAAQLSLLLFPASAGAPLSGRGVAGLADHPLLTSLFAWRDGLYLSLGLGDVREPVSPPTL
ncbi:glutathione S-transferase family protein [Synechococcus sp. CS-1329]|uniref:glutathione S-transferase family protein n=1 Tax=Synechococcus sp. CS-1329 TaxID=2847975 RepID=UPI00223C1500|nr:glutathione S-transferase family protein [Synechococcus sp. CS-1329]MCT0217623.1 glutathione S-transferase family protein [Synechococcus sp. CS-1329]